MEQPAPQLPQLDTEPDFWVEHDDLEATPDEIYQGNLQGNTIDIHDDEDNGL